MLPATTTWFESYLNDKSFRVSVQGDTARSFNCGVPQGSVLGPILFLLYTSPIGDILRSYEIDFHLIKIVIQTAVVSNIVMLIILNDVISIYSWGLRHLEQAEAKDVTKDDVEPPTSPKRYVMPRWLNKT